MKIREYAWGLLILRLCLGFNFAMHGFAKFGGGIENTSNWFDSLGLPGILAYGVALLEVLGGFALMAGLFTRFLSFLYMIVMIVAISKVQLARGFLGPGSSNSPSCPSRSRFSSAAAGCTRWITRFSRPGGLCASCVPKTRPPIRSFRDGEASGNVSRSFLRTGYCCFEKPFHSD